MEMIRALPFISSINMHDSPGPNYPRTIPRKSLFENKSSRRSCSRSLLFSGHLSFHGSGSSKPASARAGSQIESSSWVGEYLPEVTRPYARLVRIEKPSGFWFMTWPCLWSVTLAARAGGLPDPKMVAFFMFYGFVVRCTICTINDIIDRDLDAQPQMYLGIGMSMGILTAWTSIKQNIDPSIVLPLFISCLCWTIFFDTIYAHQDKKDDIKAGIKSTAIWFGSQTKPWISGLAITSIGGLALSGFNAQLGWPFYAILLAAAGHFSWQILCVDLSDPRDCNRKFVSNQYLGGIVFAGILLGRLIT